MYKTEKQMNKAWYDTDTDNSITVWYLNGKDTENNKLLT